MVAGEDVAVDLEGEGDVSVAEAFTDHPGVLAHGEQMGRVGMAEPMQREVQHVGRAVERTMSVKRLPTLSGWLWLPMTVVNT